jgi:hypothetical protein
MVGMDSDAIVISTNNYQRNASPPPPFNYIDTAVFAIPKQRAYNGWGFSFPAFAVDYSTHPAFVGGIPQGNTGKLFLASSLLSGYDLNYFDLYYMTNTAHPDLTSVTFAGNTSGTGGPTGFGRPAAVTQPGGGLLDALDGRLQAAPWQVGTKLWWVRATGFPVIQYGTIDINTRAVVSAVAYQSGPSADWNPSIGATTAGYVFLNWVYVNTATGTNVTMRVSGLSPADPVQSLTGIGTDVATGFHGSNTRFGDFSSVSLDGSAQGPCLANRSVLVVNEIFGSNGDWTSRIARVGFC